MRRGLAALILGVSLIVASVSWAGFVMTRTVLDPGRSERLADQLLDNEALRAALVGRLSDAMGSALPADVPVPRQQLEQAADAALEDERVEALIRDGIVRVHQNALEGNSEPVVVDATALGSASRDSLVAVRPELDAVLPVAPAVEIELPTSGLSWLGAVRRTVTRFTLLFALAAAAGALVSLLITSDRPGVLRRLAVWALVAAAFWMMVGYGIPYLAQTLAPSSSAIVAAIIDVFFGAMVGPASAMAMAGAVLFAASILWSTLSDRRPAAQLQPRRTQDQGQPAPTATDPIASTGGQRSNVRYATPITAPTSAVGASGPSWSSEPTSGATPPADRTVVMPSVPAVGSTEQRAASAPDWVEGVGYVNEAQVDDVDDFNSSS